MKKEPYFIRNCVAAVCILVMLTGVGTATVIRHFHQIREEIAQASESSHDLVEKQEAIVQTCDETLESNLVLRKYFATLDSNVKYFLTGDFSSNQVLMGKEDWLFYKTVSDGDPIADYVGEEKYSQEKMQKIAWNMKKFQQTLQRKGIQFVIFIAPNKEEVYAQYLPDTVEKVEEKNRTDLLVEYLREETEIPIIYPKEELCEAAKEEMLYYKNDTHWNQKGAFVGMQVLLEQLYGEKPKSLSEQEFVTVSLERGDPNYNDLSRMIGMDWKFYDQESYQIVLGEEEKKKEKVILIGDSFGVALTSCMEQAFEQVEYYHRDEDNTGILERTKPKLVVLEYVERYSGELEEFSWNNVGFTSIG
ncbi:MAG: hypothetical protein SO016_00965 [Lachnospiraceae bacterium]|nr:hypothetical protein [Robinsoniella sp.]MDY3765258.1 hypothetical protein [Lachnospiraceae bacterium]